MKTLFITTLLILTVTTGIAQEKQNDATWDETIDFIEKYKSNIEQISIDWYNLGSQEKEYIDFQIIFSSDHITFNRLNGESSSISIPLRKLHSCYEANAKWIKIKTTGDYIHYNPADLSKADFNVNRMSIWISDSEMISRIIDAFDHLTYLSKQKRKTERKASGDKF